MAENLTTATVSPKTRRRSSASRTNLSHGRGGAGNMGGNTATTDDLSTPTLKTEIYTTGRGGSGNMAKNTDPAEARKAQDVVAHPRRESASSTHIGRGGAANVFKPSKEDLEAARREEKKWENAVAVDDVSHQHQHQHQHQNEKHHKGLADKGKDWLMGKVAKA